MAHTCEAALITCEDYRLHQRKDGRNYMAQFILSQRVDCDPITRAGGVQDLVRPPELNFDKCALRDLGVSSKLHQAKVIYLINHENCGAYGEMSFSSREDEIKQHHSDLRAAKEILSREFPGKDIKLFFAELESGTEDVFIIKEVIN